ncbi:MAG: antibiotic biosynthesis monooxygenase family protein [Psychromonas sp.]
MNKQNDKAHSNPIMVIVNIQSSLISQAELHTITLTLASRTRDELGCIEYNCYRSIDDDSVLEVILFDNKEGHKAHMNSPHVLEFLDEYQSLNLQYSVQRVNYL